MVPSFPTRKLKSRLVNDQFNKVLSGCGQVEFNPTFKTKSNINSQHLLVSLSIFLLSSWTFNGAGRPWGMNMRTYHCPSLF